MSVGVHPLVYIWQIVQLLVLARCVMSWCRVGPAANPFALFIYRATEPLLEPFRRLVPVERAAGWDLSPVFLLLLGGLLVRLIVSA